MRRVLSASREAVARLRSLRPRSVHLAIGLALLVTAAVFLVAIRSPAVSQPIAFNHRKHTQEKGLGCQFCHQYVTTGAHAVLPDAQICGICHRAPQGTSAEAARVTQLLARGDPLRFNKLFRLAKHVNYTHRRHVGIAKLDCRHCHGDIAQTERPPARPLVRMAMNVCVDCHRAKGQSLDCVACHR